MARADPNLLCSPPLQRGHEVAGLVSLAEKDAMIERMCIPLYP